MDEGCGVGLLGNCGDIQYTRCVGLYGGLVARLLSKAASGVGVEKRVRDI